MDPRVNPYAPGAGTRPPDLAGRDELIEHAAIVLDRIRSGLSARSLVFIGLRGVGKTVLLNHIAQQAEARGFVTVALEVPERRSLPALLIPSLRIALLKLDRIAAVGDAAKQALRILGSFVRAMKIHFKDIDFGIELGVEAGVADSGDLANDLSDIMLAVGRAAKEKKTAVALFIDELQYIAEDQFAALIAAVHRCAQQALPLAILGAGLPHLVGQAGRAKTYAERLFEFPEIGPLEDRDARQAIESPAKRAGASITSGALDEIVRQTKGYPYFLQEWGKHCWDYAKTSPITQEDVLAATIIATAELDANFYRVRFERLTPGERRYLRAMAEVPKLPCRSGEIAKMLGTTTSSVATNRASLIEKGMIYSPSYGENSFTVPLFDGFLRRMMPQVEKMAR